MREIEFKVWDIKHQKFIDVYSICPKGRYVHVAAGDQYYLFNNENEEPEFILCQYAGLKDKNGVKIFEGDIIEDRDSGVCKIRYDENAFVIDVIKPSSTKSPYTYRHFEGLFTPYQITVISNIYQHPEFLK